MDSNPQKESPVCAVAGQLYWIADFLDLAGRAIAIIACAQQLGSRTEHQGAAQQALRSWARWLDFHPSAAAELDLVRR
jgi:hypothetical protein